MDLAKARMSANKNEPALILEVAAEWPALKMQRLFSTVFFFLKPRVSCERKVGGSHQERRTRQTDADNWKEEIRKSVQEIMI